MKQRTGRCIKERMGRGVVHPLGWAWLELAGTNCILANNTWQNVVATFGADKEIRIYVNGVLKGNSIRYTGGLISIRYINPSNVTAGSDGGQTTVRSGMIGKIDEIKIYNRALQPNEITREYTRNVIVMGYDDYDPWGAQLVGRSVNSGSSDDKYKFTGKERDNETGYDYFGHRFYDSDVARWMQVDAMADKYPNWSPYSYCLNNPINFNDPNGDSVWVTWQTGFWSFLNLGTDHKALFQDNKLYENGEEYKGDDSFVLSALSALGELKKGDCGELIVDELVGSKLNFTLKETTGENYFDHSIKTIFWNSSLTSGGLNENGNNERPAFVGLGHELAHAFDYNNFRKHGDVSYWDQNLWFQVPESKREVPLREKYACRVESLIRREHNLPLRQYYTTTEFKPAKIR